MDIGQVALGSVQHPCGKQAIRGCLGPRNQHPGSGTGAGARRVKSGKGLPKESGQTQGQAVAGRRVGLPGREREEDLPKEQAVHILAMTSHTAGGPSPRPARDRAGRSAQSGEGTVGVLRRWTHVRSASLEDKHPVLSRQPGPIFYHLLDGICPPALGPQSLGSKPWSPRIAHG